MIFQILVSVALLLTATYAITQKGKSTLVSLVTFLCSALAFYLVWAPDSATAIAHLLGIGRGADLVFYCWGLISFALLLNLHFKMLKNLEQITVLARKLAIMEAEQAMQGRRDG